MRVIDSIGSFPKFCELYTIQSISTNLETFYKNPVNTVVMNIAWELQCTVIQPSGCNNEGTIHMKLALLVAETIGILDEQIPGVL